MQLLLTLMLLVANLAYTKMMQKTEKLLNSLQMGKLKKIHLRDHIEARLLVPYTWAMHCKKIILYRKEWATCSIKYIRGTSCII